MPGFIVIDSTGFVKSAASGVTLSTASGTLVVANGGTGDTTLTAHGVLLGEGTSAVAATAAGTSGQPLLSGGASADPSFQASLAVTNGGTGLTALTAGDTLYASAANTLSALAKDTNATRYLSNTGASNIPAWAQVALATGVSGSLPVANLTNGVTTVVTTTSTGTQNDFAPGLSGNTLLFCNNASDLTISGFSGGTAGQTLTIVSRGAGHVYLKHANASSSANNRLINYATSGDTALATGAGTAVYEWGSDGTISRWFLVAHTQGALISPAFSASDYTASASMTWTVESADVATYAYSLNGRLLTMFLFISTTTVGGTPDSQLRVAVPNGFTIALSNLTPSQSIDNGTALTGLLSANTSVSTTKLLVFRDFAGANWAAATNATHVRGSITFLVT